MDLLIPETLDVPVTCPYCRIGSGYVRVTKYAGEEKVEGLHDPLQCRACLRYFKVRLQMLFKGEPITGEPRVVPQGDILRRITGLS